MASLVRERDIVSFPVRCDSISLGGLGARGRGLEDLRLDDLITMELRFPISAQPIWVNTTVRYSVLRRRTGQCGLQFLSLSEEQHSLIERYCRQQPLKKHRWWS